MNYIVVTVLTTLVLVAQNIILLNEETLILICFVSFCWLSLKNLSDSFSEDLDKRAYNIQSSLTKSLEETSSALKSALNVQNRFWNLFFDFKLMGNNCVKFVNSITDWSVNHKIKLNKLPFPRRLQFVSRLEKQASKLISLILISKLRNVTNLKHYYSHYLNNSHFLCTNKVNIREYLQTIKK